MSDLYINLRKFDMEYVIRILPTILSNLFLVFWASVQIWSEISSLKSYDFFFFLEFYFPLLLLFIVFIIIYCDKIISVLHHLI